ncbi:uncharacterized protein LOC131627884 [Vicia villosa]|uniref:uncharacterized protein LOC131627884 n=1 Tax=Vicia villosa TaxID=3911 RepID=UPI00273B6915|nr:uncharacterized protein LOC131627884 [Vicia villosa]
MLSEEDDDCWVATRAELDSDGIAITWAIFKREFLRKYFPEYVRGRKEIEFLELKWGSMTEPEYASKFVELAKYYVHYNNDAAGEFSKCIKFENDLRDEIKQGIRIFEEVNLRLKSSHSHELVNKKGKKPMYRGKPYGKGNSKADNGKRPSGGDSGTFVRCYNCGEVRHCRNECRAKQKTCFNCGKVGHVAVVCSVITSSTCLSGPIDILEVSVEDLAMTATQVSEAVKD